MNELRLTPFHRALHRSNLILGGDRGWMIFVLFITGMLVLVSMNTVSLITGMIFGFVGVTALRVMAKIDPLFVKQRAILSRLGVETASNSFHLGV